MDYFSDVLITFLGLELVVALLSMQGWKALLICVTKMNKVLTGLEWREGE